MAIESYLNSASRKILKRRQKHQRQKKKSIILWLSLVLNYLALYIFLSPEMRATTRYKAWWTEKWMWGSPWLQELRTWVDCSIRLTMHTSSELRNPRPRYDNKYISSCEMPSFFEALHNSYCPHLLWAHLQTIFVSWYNSHLLMLLQAFLPYSHKCFGKSLFMVKKQIFRVHPREAFYFLSGSFLGLSVAIKILRGASFGWCRHFLRWLSNIKNNLKREISYSIISSP